MNNNYSTKKYKIIASLLALAIILLSIPSIADYFSRQGGVRVTINTLPDDAIIKVDGKVSKRGDVYLRPGVHTFSAEKEGYTKDSQSHTVLANTPLNVYLTPQPYSSTTIKDHQEINQLKKEAMDDDRASSINQEVVNNNKILNYLPRININGPYRIDYNIPKDESIKERYIIIGVSTPDGRQNAIKWLRSTGIDPTTLDIRYDNSFTNYLAGGAK